MRRSKRIFRGISASVLIVVLRSAAVNAGDSVEADVAVLADSLSAELGLVAADASAREAHPATARLWEAFAARADRLATDMQQQRPRSETVRHYRDLQAMKRELIALYQVSDDALPRPHPAQIEAIKELLRGLSLYYESR